MASAMSVGFCPVLALEVQPNRGEEVIDGGLVLVWHARRGRPAGR
jgi:hypothetical protein